MRGVCLDASGNCNYSSQCVRRLNSPGLPCPLHPLAAQCPEYWFAERGEGRGEALDFFPDNPRKWQAQASTG